MDPTIEEANAKRFHYENYKQLRKQLNNSIGAYNFSRPQKIFNNFRPMDIPPNAGTKRLICGSLYGQVVFESGPIRT